ncbi:diguanylate cyclase [Saccharothrix violaceirubra]|uniref:Diguanylate cyclase (GGDEF)-like protein/PAS domain S-box-containing protein n=1 Tax=Saccharothrix violaceirubra TaxID=413306 RepID=A0A7W7T750_9PSEU|nr:diguanylate cyclase [Saccharothrix violaceirubra]MBB4967798.1 diguanylate cyclase (GGDEF)-like protein/PAS domain S-box-containing protein [Saccharothrix violaceirubra]
MRAVHPTAYVPLSPAEIEEFLLDQVDELLAICTDEPFRADDADEVGKRLVRTDFTDSEAIRVTVELLAKALADAGVPADRLVSVLAAVGAGYAAGLRQHVFDQQEAVKNSLWTAKRRVERVLAASEARFREVFESSAIGIAITDLHGECVEANEALAGMVDRTLAELTGLRLTKLFHADDADPLTDAYRAARSGRVDRFREQRRLVRGDGEPLWVHLAVSLLRDGDGTPAYFVTMVEDVSELHLLQKNLDHQLLHDSLTGLSNRQHFVSRLESMHGARRGAITLYQLDLDSFAVVNNGLGHAVGDELLKEVGRRLEHVVAPDRAFVARIGADEFAIVAPSADTARVPAMIERINEALDRPLPSGAALSATVGVLHRPDARWDVAEVLRAANSTLRRAKAKGKRQWLTYDRHHDAVARPSLEAAARMPGALRDGAIDVEYQPVVAPGSDVVGYVARLRWDGFGHDRCVEMADANGLALTLGQWALHEATGTAAGWAHGVLHVELSAMQSRDADLVATVQRTLADTGLAASSLKLWLDTRAMLDGAGEDNAQVLRDNGIAVGLTRYNGGQAELALARELGVDSLLVAPTVVRRLAREDESVLHTAMSVMTGVVRRTGLAVAVPEVDTPTQARWWTGIGVDLVFGSYYGDPVPSWELA